MGSDSEEQVQLRSVALENALSILRARQKADREIIAAKEALEQKAHELDRTVEELGRQREWFQVTLSSIGDGVIATDIHGKIALLNPAAEAMTGWKSAEAQGLTLRTVFNIVNEQTRESADNPIEKVLREGISVALANHTSLIARDGTEIAIEDSAAPIRDRLGNLCGAVLVFHDVTARRQTENALRNELKMRQRAEQALREADRRKDDLLATLAHELRNPLAPILQAALISRDPEASAAQKRWSHEVIDRQVKNMALLLDDLLDISRVTRGTLTLHMQPTQLASVVETAVETARPIIDAKRHKLSVDMQSETGQFTADPLRVAQVISNLLTNAAKYTHPEGQIRLVARCESADVVVRVSDTGIGISADTLPLIFNMFWQAHTTGKRAEGGLGIGLALAKRIVELHGGRIEAQSAGLGGGSEFVVKLPRTLNTASAPSPSAAQKALAT